MDNILNIKFLYSGGATIRLGKFFPTNATNRTKLLDMIRDGDEDPEEQLDIIIDFLTDESNKMLKEATESLERFERFKYLSQEHGAYTGLLKSADYQVKYFLRMQEKYEKELTWWKSHR